MQELLVGIIVLLAAAYLAARYLPAAWRRELALRLTRGGTRESRLARWIDKSGAGCGSGCDSCSTDELRPPAHTQGKHKVIKLHQKR